MELLGVYKSLSFSYIVHFVYHKLASLVGLTTSLRFAGLGECYHARRRFSSYFGFKTKKGTSSVPTFYFARSGVLCQKFLLGNSQVTSQLTEYVYRILYEHSLCYHLLCKPLSVDVVHQVVTTDFSNT